jgi:flagellar hook-basal body complex protein FliE
MAIAPVPNIGTAISLPGIAQVNSKPASSDGGFGSLLKEVVNEANSKQQAADQAVENFASGNDEDIQNVVVSMAKADLSFRMVMEIRNRLIDSYQEIMRMQV